MKSIDIPLSVLLENPLRILWESFKHPSFSSGWVSPHPDTPADIRRYPSGVPSPSYANRVARSADWRSINPSRGHVAVKLPLQSTPEIQPPRILRLITSINHRWHFRLMGSSGAPVSGKRWQWAPWPLDGGHRSQPTYHHPIRPPSDGSNSAVWVGRQEMASRRTGPSAPGPVNQTNEWINK